MPAGTTLAGATTMTITATIEIPTQDACGNIFADFGPGRWRVFRAALRRRMTKVNELDHWSWRADRELSHVSDLCSTGGCWVEIEGAEGWQQEAAIRREIEAALEDTTERAFGAWGGMHLNSCRFSDPRTLGA